MGLPISSFSGPARREAESIRTEGGGDAIPPPHHPGGKGRDCLQGTGVKTGDVSPRGHTARCKPRAHQKPGPLTLQAPLTSPGTIPPPAPEVGCEMAGDAGSFQGHAGSFPQSCLYLHRPPGPATCLNLHKAQPRGNLCRCIRRASGAFSLQEDLWDRSHVAAPFGPHAHRADGVRLRVQREGYL